MAPQAGQVPALTKGQAAQVPVVKHTVPVSCTVATVQDTGTVLTTSYAERKAEEVRVWWVEAHSATRLRDV